MGNKIKHLEFIQSVIDRQARNSFLLKGWAITLVVATLAFKEADFAKTLLIYFLIFMFWFLDSYYLWQEKKFRCLYNHVRKLPEGKIDFDMNTNEAAKKDGCSWIDVITSRTLIIFYSALMIFTFLFLNWR